MRDYSIILAADVNSPERVVQLTRQVGGIVDGLKINEATLLQTGVSIIPTLRELLGDKPILVDLKIADIGFYDDGEWLGTNSKIVRALAGSGATHVTAHGFPGPVSAAESVAAARDVGIQVLLLPLMSHAGARMCFSRPLSRSDVAYSALKAGLELDFPEDITCDDVTDGILLLGEALDVAGYIGPATRPTELTRYRAKTRRPIWCPGFGRQERLGRGLAEQFREWARIVGPASAAIVGSVICNADDPGAAAREITQIRDSVAASPA